ncbi:SDR family NAD(P)-dependent oxidoreductase [Amycolatopsis sp. PS_44_ISF1]|uniref:SDR family NAD(P)-dependent oxidoreductase n=1 Tax=Amycolatopsis sp. PS_44_ISF1 TaxID=2974917 RepID=UPI0028DDC9B1|nr:SDR family NAD(P)-dependent oxidoreductase [Amycolatopsis sp. PS_44_ISF1]MDT8915160.1 SDR family NAD(P)-dependent oxidoreductase [Amycolatopsis sp. PS_44_ISF1]
MTTHLKRAVLVTGGGSGIGLGLAERYLAAGHRVVITGRDSGRLAEAARRRPGLETFTNDLAAPDGRRRLADHVGRVMPELDVLINNAGLQRRTGIASDGSPWSEEQHEIDVLFAAPVHLSRLLVPRMLAHGRPGVLVNVTSGGAFVPQPFAPLYSAAKAALHSYTTNLRHALKATPIRVVELIPPAVATGLAGPGPAHGADPAEFCDAVFPALDGSRPEVGFGPTATAEFTGRRAAEQQVFDDLSGRFDVPVYGA